LKHVTFVEPRVWVRPKEACRIASLGLTRLYELLDQNVLESRKLGRARLISVRSIEALGLGDQQGDAA
jgi:hypothetical protein